MPNVRIFLEFSKINNNIEKIVHRDLAARNILLDADLTPKVTMATIIFLKKFIKISDFGLSRTVRNPFKSTHKTKHEDGALKVKKILRKF